MLAARRSNGLSECVGGRDEDRIKDEGPELRQRLPHGTASLVPRAHGIELASERRRTGVVARSGPNRFNQGQMPRADRVYGRKPLGDKPTSPNASRRTC